MSGNCTRRGFIGAALGLAAAAHTGRAKAATTGNPYYRVLQAYLYPHFNSTQRAIINGAVAIVAHRFLDPRMFSWARARYRSARVEVPGLQLKTSAQFEGWFYRIQLAALTARGFPALQIKGEYAPNGGWTGRAPIYTVSTQYYSDTKTGRYVPYVSGKFTITLNTALLANPRVWYGNSTSNWAGTIAHEMLHNLGHEHPENVYDGMFIRAYERAITLNADPRVGA